MAREQQVRDAVERFLARVRQETDAHLGALAADLLHIAEGDMRTARLDVERAAVDVARAVAKGGAHARHDLISRVVLAVRRLDDARTLRGILDALSEGAAAEAGRVAVLLVDAETLRTYRFHGFAPGLNPGDLSAEASPMVAGAIRLPQTTVVPPAGDRPDPSLPAFMRVPEGHTGMLVPLVVGKEVVALLYADGADRQGMEVGAPVWTEQVEVLVRHASARLENVTSQRTVEVLSHSS